MILTLRCAKHDVPLQCVEQEAPFLVDVNPDNWQGIDYPFNAHTEQWEIDLSNMGCPTDDGSECADSWVANVLTDR